MLNEPIPVYFSHSYRKDEQNNNIHFWKEIGKHGFAFSVDPPSDIAVYAYLERMMNRSGCFVAVIPHRPEVPRFQCSQFMLYEYGLSVQARRPRLLLIDREVGTHFFPPNRPDIYWFNVGKLEADLDDLEKPIADLQKNALPRHGIDREPKKPIGLIVPREGREACYGGEVVQARMEELSIHHGFEWKPIKVPYVHNAQFAHALDDCEFVVVDVRGDDIPAWVFAYLFGRLIPSIKLAQLKNDSEYPHSISLPPLVRGMRMDENEDVVETVNYWRTEDDLLHEFGHALSKMSEKATVFEDTQSGVSYFGSIGRRPAKVFISNSSRANDLALKLAAKLRINNIQNFQYKVRHAIKAGQEWEKRIIYEVKTSDVFVALVGQGYEESAYCRMELEIAKQTAASKSLKIIPYKLEEVGVGFLDPMQGEDLVNFSDDNKDAGDLQENRHVSQR